VWAQHGLGVLEMTQVRLRVTSRVASGGLGWARVGLGDHEWLGVGSAWVGLGRLGWARVPSGELYR